MRWMLVPLAVLLAGCASYGETSKSTSRSQASAAAAPPPTTPPAAASSSVGDTITTTAGNTYTVVEYVDHFESTNQFDKPPAGGFYAAIRIKACAGSKALDVTPAAFDLIEPDDSHITPATAVVAGGKTPDLSSGTLQPGECVSGWINYGVSARPKRIAKTDSDLRWTVPPA